MLDINAGVTLEILAIGNLSLGPGAKLINDGTLKIDEGGGRYSPAGISFVCDTTGGNAGKLVNNQRIELDSNTYISPSTCSPIPVLLNNPGATITAGPRADSPTINVAIDNRGIVDAGSGILYITADGPNTPIVGTWRASANGSLIFSKSGSMAFNNPTLQNFIRLTNATTTGTITVDTGASVLGDSGTIRATVKGPGAFYLDGATLDADPTPGGPRFVYSGTVVNTHHVNAGVTLEIVGVGSLNLAPGARLINNGTLKIDGGGGRYSPAGISFVCDTTAVNPGMLVNNHQFELDSNAYVSPSGCASVPVLLNSLGATITSGPRADSPTINVAIDNRGIVDAGSGILYIAADGPNTPIVGTWRASSNGTLIFSKFGSMAFNNPTLQNFIRLTNATTTGTITVDTGASVLADSGTIRANVKGPGVFYLDGATLDADPTPGGRRFVYSGTLVNTHHINASVTVEILGVGSLNLAPGARLINDGTLKIDGGGGPYSPAGISFVCDTTGSNPGILVNHQQFELDSNAYVSPSGCASVPVLVNSAGAIITTRPGADSPHIGVALDNRGSVAVVTGSTLRLAAASNNNGTVSVSTGGSLLLGAAFTNRGSVDLGGGSGLQLSGALFDNWQTVTFGDGADWSCSPSCNIVNEASGTINLNGGGDFTIAEHFHNKGFIVFHGTAPREYHRTGIDVTLGQGKIDLSAPAWAVPVHNFTLPAKSNDLPLPYTVSTTFGPCLNGVAGLVLGVSASVCDLSHFPAGSTKSDQDGWVATVGSGLVFGVTAGVGLQFTPKIDSIRSLENWSYCFGVDIPVGPFSGGGVICKDILKDQGFPLGDDKNIMMTYVQTAPNPYTIIGNLGVGWTISKKGPWESDGFGAFFYTAVANCPSWPTCQP